MTARIRLYGIPNCNTVKKARGWLGAQGAEHDFHDLKKLGVPPAALDGWIAAASIEVLLNRRGTTWRGLHADQQAAAGSAAAARALLLAQPGLIKRPVVEWPSGEVSVGFSEAAFAARLAHRTGP